MSTDAIFEKYATALADLGADSRQLSGDAVLLALRLAIADAYAAAPVIATDLAAIVASQDKALQEALDRIDPLREERNALQAQVAILEEELDRRRESGAAWVAEIDSLRQQLARIDADNAALLNKVHQAQSEIDRLTQQNVIAGGTFDSLPKAHGNGVDPTPTPEWNRNHPAWNGFSDMQMLYRLQIGDLRFRNLSKGDRRDLVRRVLRHLADGGEPVTGPQFDRLRPAWMPTAGAVVLLVESRKWHDLLDLAAAPA